jgi:hypothetical protein
VRSRTAAVACVVACAIAAPAEAQARDVVRGDAVFRSFRGQPPSFHPLASFARLNVLVSRGQRRAADRAARALIRRARPSGAALVWDYRMRAPGGRTFWCSGLAQAVAAQALARAGYPREARRAYLAIPRGLLARTSAGPWIRLYSFDAAPVLNAQLQAIVSLRAYARLTRDRDAARLAARMRRAAVELLPRYDTGIWSRYSLGGASATLEYHKYVARLLWKLARHDRELAPYAARFSSYWRFAPRIRPGAPGDVAYPVPADGFRDEAIVRFWLSKPAHVRLDVARTSTHATLPAGWHDLAWAPGDRPPGRYVAHLTAVDGAGNRAVRRLPDVRLAHDVTAPELAAEVAGTTLWWRGRDDETPWVELRVDARRGESVETIDLGRRALRGHAWLPIPLDLSWYGIVVATDSSGNETIVPLGRVDGTHGLPREA